MLSWLLLRIVQRVTSRLLKQIIFSDRDMDQVQGLGSRSYIQRRRQRWGNMTETRLSHCPGIFSSRSAANVDQYKEYFMNIISSFWFLLCSFEPCFMDRSFAGVKGRYYKMLSEQFGSGGSSGREACAKWCLLLLFCHIIITTNLTHTSLIYSTPANHYFLSPTHLSRKVKYEDDGVWSYSFFFQSKFSNSVHFFPKVSLLNETKLSDSSFAIIFNLLREVSSIGQTKSGSSNNWLQAGALISV